MEPANEKKGMEQARQFLKADVDELISVTDIETLDNKKLKLLENMLKIYKDLLDSDKVICEMIAKNQKMQLKILFFFAGLFGSEIIYSLAIGSGYVEPINLKILMLVFILLFMALVYSFFRK